MVLAICIARCLSIFFISDIVCTQKYDWINLFVTTSVQCLYLSQTFKVSKRYAWKFTLRLFCILYSNNIYTLSHHLYSSLYSIALPCYLWSRGRLSLALLLFIILQHYDIDISRPEREAAQARRLKLDEFLADFDPHSD